MKEVPDQPDETCLRVNIKGGIQVCVPPSIRFMTPYILLEQEDWFEEEIHFIRKLLHEGMNVIDIGANYGLYTLTMSKIIGPSGKIWAFEPTSLTAAFLRKSILANHLTNVELVQAGLSDKKGTAKISLNPDPEMNAITDEPDSGSKYETVELLNLDECENTYPWDTIDFIKLDAEGQEHNIVLGGKHFLSTRSPLIMFELKHVHTINTALINDFLELGYQLYHLVPGLNILAPIDLAASFDRYQLNLFCCKRDRAQLLQEQGLLVTEIPSPGPISDASAWQQGLQTMPYFLVFMGCWASIGQGKTLPGWDHYENALNYYVMAHSENQKAHSRYASLQKAWEESSRALDLNVNISRLITHVRIQSELGKRGDSLLTVDTILNLIGTEQTVILSEPFIPVSPRFDNVIPKELNKWLLASILEYREKAIDLSSFYTGRSSLEYLKIMGELGHQSPEMERRRQLVRMRYGLQREPIPVPILSNKTQDNMNPDFWNSADSTFAKASLMSRDLACEKTETTITQLRPRLSICIPTYNRADILQETLEHLEQVCGDDVEIVISDNCSPDKTQDVIDSYRRRFRHFRSIRQPENRGAWKNFATAISLATGKYIYTLCDDDQVYADGLQAAVSIMDENPRIVGVYGGYQEWDRSTEKILATLNFVDQRTDFVQGDKLKVFNRFIMLWFPVCRRDIFQRYFTYDNQSFGMWELVGTLLEHGDIATIPDLFYLHSQTVPRMEYELTESWYHDAHRAQYECFAGRFGPLDFAELSTFINSRVAQAYMQGARFAGIKHDFLRYRYFLLRSRAYGLVTEAQVMEWEKREMVNMVAQRLLGHVELISGIEEVLFEDTPQLQPFREQFSAIASGYATGKISQDKWLESGLRPNQYLVTYAYGSPGWSDTVHLGPARCRAVQDMIETCRITDQPLEF